MGGGDNSHFMYTAASAPPPGLLFYVWWLVSLGLVLVGLYGFYWFNHRMSSASMDSMRAESGKEEGMKMKKATTTSPTDRKSVV